ncbi:type 2 glycerol-3-phosphate oxidase [Mesoplasma lactucae]|uniref:Glycerol-3-phosphate dehydrogenase n=1 Tax=Mesoplasma lactucae ATCC 49193 TaxID=81460 RepID=A0A291ISW5_9MOLU|nr:type 2 glycerol-3-phosphate oxidase [Mesoplasma lactucae]ATG97796.1 glycerol-3-phosphate dehydrogenase [Mesoplasma lactucae ATCC 49193]ATZ20426.1 glycerol-3-phospate oxidase [Mesoplasma lactucae ATCC 49193]MCL8216598.1 hypothetical protein [Mesoplasma lactucae ATCC 49193]
MKNQKYDIIIIGGGVIGAAIARELGQYDKKVLVLEANPRVADETSFANSGLVHGGFDATPGKLNAKLGVEGKHRYEDWIKEMEFPYKRVPSIVAAFDEADLDQVQVLYDRGLKNGLKPEEMKILSKEEVKKLEPHISDDVVGALYCDSSIALQTPSLTRVLFMNAIKNGVTLKTGCKVTNITKQDKTFKVDTNQGQFESDFIINVAGHYADEISKMAGHDEFKLVARRGQYRILEKTASWIVKNVVFMVPTIHGKGVVVAPMLDGRVMVGPTATENIAKDKTRIIDPKVYDEIGEIGTRMFPEIPMDETITTYAGSRPIEPENDDFWIKPTKTDDHFINVAGMKSPAISSAPAIADMVIDLLQDANKKPFAKNKNYDPIQKTNWGLDL